jgi:hypothetical protein
MVPNAGWFGAVVVLFVVPAELPGLLPSPLVRGTTQYGRWDYRCGSYVLLFVIPIFVHASVEGGFLEYSTISLIAEVNKWWNNSRQRGFSMWRWSLMCCVVNETLGAVYCVLRS